MTDPKASQTTTRRDIPSARKLPDAKAPPKPKDRPSGVCRATPPSTKIPEEDELEDKEAAPESAR